MKIKVKDENNVVTKVNVMDTSFWGIRIFIETSLNNLKEVYVTKIISTLSQSIVHIDVPNNTILNTLFGTVFALRNNKLNHFEITFIPEKVDEELDIKYGSIYILNIDNGNIDAVILQNKENLLLGNWEK